MEKFHAFVTFPLLTLYFVLNHSFIKTMWFTYGMLICIFILFQGQKYWKLKLWSLEKRPFSHTKNLEFFKMAQRTNLVLLGISPVIFAIQLLFLNWSPKDVQIILWSFFANTFALLEYINYYQKQLMIDNQSDLKYILRNKKLKPASLAKDLKQNKF